MAKKRREKYPVVCQKWRETKRGRGTMPDGFSLHFTDEDRRRFVEDYWAEMPKKLPNAYSRPGGTPHVCEVDEKTYEEIRKSKNGIRRYNPKIVNYTCREASTSGSP